MKPIHRFEFKYVLDPAKARMARERVQRILERDPQARTTGSYIVTSLYFDTPQMKDYYEKSGGFLERKKMRARIYAPSWDGISSIRLEIKKKHDMAFEKAQVWLTPNEWRDFLQQRWAHLLEMPRAIDEQKTFEEFVWYTIQEGRRPLLLVRYQRTPFLFEADDTLRITFDERIECKRATDLSLSTFMTPVSPLHVVMEVKFGAGLPTWFHDMLKELHLQRDSFSKYERSWDALHAYNPLPR